MRPAGSRDIWLMERPLVSGFEYSKVVHGRIVPLLKGCRVGGFHRRRKTSLRRALNEFIEHYHAERNRQGKGNVLLLPSEESRRRRSVSCRERLGGLLRYYGRAA